MLLNDKPTLITLSKLEILVTDEILGAPGGEADTV